MKLVLTILAVAVFALSLVADHKWRKWMAERREAQKSGDPTRNLRS